MFRLEKMDGLDYGFLSIAGLSFLALVVGVSCLLIG
ncbi:hypothetical protein ACVIW0_003880 [Bradyrhizobium sp. USDA 4454]